MAGNPRKCLDLDPQHIGRLATHQRSFCCAGDNGLGEPLAISCGKGIVEISARFPGWLYLTGLFDKLAVTLSVSGRRQ